MIMVESQAGGWHSITRYGGWICRLTPWRQSDHDHSTGDVGTRGRLRHPVGREGTKARTACRQPSRSAFGHRIGWGIFWPRWSVASWPAKSESTRVLGPSCAIGQDQARCPRRASRRCVRAHQTAGDSRRLSDSGPTRVGFASAASYSGGRRCRRQLVGDAAGAAGAFMGPAPHACAGIYCDKYSRDPSRSKADSDGGRS